MKPLKNMIGERSGRLIVTARAENGDSGQARWLCRCDCGAETIQYGKVLRKQIVRSCGCLRRETSAKMGGGGKTHGLTKSPEYKAWRSMRDRCYRETHENFHNYGGRGISVAPAWKDDFQAFFAHVGLRPSPKYSLDRYPDQNGNYEPGNVRWATWQEQANNRRTNYMIEYAGEIVTLAEAIRRSGLNGPVVRQRIVNGWPMSRVFEGAAAHG